MLFTFLTLRSRGFRGDMPQGHEPTQNPNKALLVVLCVSFYLYIRPHRGLKEIVNFSRILDISCQGLPIEALGITADG